MNKFEVWQLALALKLWMRKHKKRTLTKDEIMHSEPFNLLVLENCNERKHRYNLFAGLTSLGFLKAKNEKVDRWRIVHDIMKKEPKTLQQLIKELR